MTEDNRLPCSDKIAYASPEEARAADAANSYRYKKPRLKPYKCRYCQLFHLTSAAYDE